jgi:hypothetical protein
MFVFERKKYYICRLSVPEKIFVGRASGKIKILYNQKTHTNRLPFESEQ